MEVAGLGCGSVSAGMALTQCACLGSPKPRSGRRRREEAGCASFWRGFKSSWLFSLCLEILEKPCSGTLVKMNPRGEPRVGRQRVG